MSLWRSDHPSRGVLPTAVCHRVWSRKLNDQAVLARVGLLPQKGRIRCYRWNGCAGHIFSLIDFHIAVGLTAVSYKWFLPLKVLFGIVLVLSLCCLISRKRVYLYEHSPKWQNARNCAVRRCIICTLLQTTNKSRTHVEGKCTHFTVFIDVSIMEIRSPFIHIKECQKLGRFSLWKMIQYLEEIVVNWRIELKWVLNKIVIRVWAVSVWLSDTVWGQWLILTDRGVDLVVALNAGHLVNSWMTARFEEILLNQDVCVIQYHVARENVTFKWDLRRVGKNCEKRLFSFVVSVRMRKLGCFWMDFDETLYFSTSGKFVEKIRFSLKCDQNNGYFTSRLTYIYYSILRNSS
jgi:hypothetical protein